LLLKSAAWALNAMIATILFLLGVIYAGAAVIGLESLFLPGFPDWVLPACAFVMFLVALIVLRLFLSKIGSRYFWGE